MMNNMMKEKKKEDWHKKIREDAIDLEEVREDRDKDIQDSGDLGSWEDATIEAKGEDKKQVKKEEDLPLSWEDELGDDQETEKSKPKEQLKLKEKEQLKPKEKEQPKPKEKELKSKEKEQPKPKEKEQLKPKEKEQPKPKEKEKEKEKDQAKTSGPVPREGGERLSGILKALQNGALKYSAISPFAALSGNTDKFNNVQSMVQSLRSGIWLESVVTPVTQNKDLHGQDLLLNAYALDFYKHGRFALLLKDNGFRSGEAWQLLKKWSLFLEDTTKALELYAPADSNVLKTFKYLNKRFNEYFAAIGHVVGE